MLNKSVVNVAVGAGGRYAEGQKRLWGLLEQFEPEAARMFYMGNDLPRDWPTHHEKPYAFKAYALEEARQNGAELVLWCDASVVPIRPLDALWKKIEYDGYWIARNGWANYEWTAESAYPDLFPHFSLEEARRMNRMIPHVVATAFGLNLTSPIGQAFLRKYYQLARETNAFCGPWSNADGQCGPPDVRGHRHDQTAASVIAHRLGMKLTDCPEFFAYPPGADNTILLAVGA